jgi:hypothetical protein
MAQLSYIRFDTDFFDKPKIKGLVQRHGQVAVSFLVRLLCGMGRATDGEISRDAWEAIGAEAGLATLHSEELVGYCLDNHILGGSKERLTNTRVLEDQDALEKKRVSTRARVQQHRQRQKPAEDAPVPLATAAPAVVNPSAPFVPFVPPADVAAYTPQHPESFDTTDENMQIALDKLEAPNGQNWVFDNRFIGAGRRPMKDYPTIWLTPHELSDVIRKLEESDIPQASYKDLFFKAEAKLKTYSSQGRSNQSVSVYNWLTGFLFDELLERTIKETRLAKTLEGGQYERRRA